MSGHPHDQAALYDGHGMPLTSCAPMWNGLDGMVHARSVCHLLFNVDAHTFDGTVDRVFALPVGPNPLPIPHAILAELVATLDGNGAIALHADCAEAIALATDAVLALAGGSRA